MSRQGLQNALDFIIETSQDLEEDPIVIGAFNKYSVLVIADSNTPHFYVQYIGDEVGDDVLYRFSLKYPSFDGMGEFEEGDELDQFLLEHGASIIYNGNMCNPDHSIENTGILKYN